MLLEVSLIKFGNILRNYGLTREILVKEVSDFRGYQTVKRSVLPVFCLRRIYFRTYYTNSKKLGDKVRPETASSTK